VTSGEIAQGLTRGIVDAELDAGVDQGFASLGEELCGHVAVYEERLDGIAHAGALDLGVERDLGGHGEIGGLVHVEGTDAVVMFDDRDAGGFHHGLDQATATAGDEQVDDACAFAEQTDRVAVGDRHKLDGRGGQAGGGEAARERRGDGSVGTQRFRTAAEDHGVATLQAETGGIAGDVGTGLVDEADDAERDANLGNLDAVGLRPLAEKLTDGVGERSDLLQAVRARREAFRVEREAVNQRGGLTVGLGCGDIEGVGGKDLGLRGEQGVGHRHERGVDAGGRRGRQRARSGAGLGAHGRDE